MTGRPSNRSGVFLHATDGAEQVLKRITGEEEEEVLPVLVRNRGNRRFRRFGVWTAWECFTGNSHVDALPKQVAPIRGSRGQSIGHPHRARPTFTACLALGRSPTWKPPCPTNRESPGLRDTSGAFQIPAVIENRLSCEWPIA
jgi:hypothetical protein